MSHKGGGSSLSPDRTRRKGLVLALMIFKIYY